MDKGNAQSLHHVMNLMNISTPVQQYSILHGGDYLLESNVEKTDSSYTLKLLSKKNKGEFHNCS